MKNVFGKNIPFLLMINYIFVGHSVHGNAHMSMAGKPERLSKQLQFPLIAQEDVTRETRRIDYLLGKKRVFSGLCNTVGAGLLLYESFLVLRSAHNFLFGAPKNSTSHPAEQLDQFSSWRKRLMNFGYGCVYAMGMGAAHQTAAAMAHYYTIPISLDWFIETQTSFRDLQAAMKCAEQLRIQSVLPESIHREDVARFVYRLLIKQVCAILGYMQSRSSSFERPCKDQVRVIIKHSINALNSCTKIINLSDKTSSCVALDTCFSALNADFMSFRAIEKSLIG